MKIISKKDNQVYQYLGILGKDIGLVRVVGYDGAGNILAWPHNQVLVDDGKMGIHTPVVQPSPIREDELVTDAEDEVPEIKGNKRK